MELQENPNKINLNGDTPSIPESVKDLDKELLEKEEYYAPENEYLIDEKPEFEEKSRFESNIIFVVLLTVQYTKKEMMKM